MKVILNQDIKGTGKKGDIVEVADGFAKNFLIKKNLACIANYQNLNNKKSKDQALEHQKELELNHAKEIFEKLNDKKIEIKYKSGANGKLFGSVTSKEIAKEINNKFNIEIDKRKISLDIDIKNFGVYSAYIKLHQKVTAEIKVSVIEEM